MWLWGCLAPHPPIIVPAVGRGREREASLTLGGMESIAQRLREKVPDVLLVLSPHAPFGEGLMFVDALRYEGGLKKFGVGELLFEAPGNREATDELIEVLSSSLSPRRWTTDRFELDHASVVPLTWLAKTWGNLPSLVLANPIGLTYSKAHLLGKRLLGLKDTHRRWALLASGDLSHRVTLDAPAGFHPDGKRFDAIVVEALKSGDPKRLLELDAEFIDRAGECGLRSVLTLLGLAGGRPLEVFSYEAPFGVGYSTALWENNREEENFGQDLPGLARAAIRRFLEKGQALTQNEGQILAPWKSLWEARKACFVSLKNRADGSLRGCIGTLEPHCPSLGEEIIKNAVASATRDPRFEPVNLPELEKISVSVDVLSSPERIAGTDGLDPERFGVIVEKGGRRGVLLPDLEGVETIEEQLQIACRKAGLPNAEGAALWRFTVKRHAEETRG